jgi:hypothetical protein
MILSSEQRETVAQRSCIMHESNRSLEVRWEQKTKSTKICSEDQFGRN